MTYGDLKFRLTQQFPTVSLDLIEGWANDRYAEILGELPWSRQNIQAILQTTAPYSTGTVALTLGSSGVTLTGGTFTTQMTGRGFRVTGRDEFYEFTYVGATTATLDRPYEGPTATAAAYSIFQHIYPLPADCRLLADDAFNNVWGQLRRYSHGELNQSVPTRPQSGTPEGWASYMDDSSTPPRMQVELYPIPDKAIGIPFTYSADAGALDDTSTILQVWMQPTALIEGTVAKIKRHLKDYAGAQLAAADAKMALANMRTSEAQGMAPAQIRLSSYYTAHRRKRWCR
jgi:hypothetical protein